jgi:hypothetical protein
VPPNRARSSNHGGVGLKSEIILENSFFDELGRWCCEGTVMGIYFNGILEGHNFKWGTEIDIVFPPGVYLELRKTVGRTTFSRHNA